MTVIWSKEVGNKWQEEVNSIVTSIPRLSGNQSGWVSLHIPVPLAGVPYTL